MDAEPKPTEPTTSAFTMSLILALVGVGLFVALLSNEFAPAALCLLVFSTMAAAKIWSRFGLARVQGDLWVDSPRLFPGEKCTLGVEVANAKFLPVWLEARVALGTAVCSDAGQVLTQDTGLWSHQRVTFSFGLEALRRGVHRLGPVELTAADPFGFYPRTRRAASCELIVYPRLVPLHPLPLPRRDLYGKPGQLGLIGDPAYINGIRDYRGGSARYIHWKVSASHQRLLEKICEPTAREQVLLLIRTDGFLEDSTGQVFEHCLEVAASAAVQLERQGYSVGLITNGGLQGDRSAVVKTSRAPGQLATLLEVLARLGPAPTGELLDSVQNEQRLTSTTVLCFCYELDAGGAALREYLVRRRVPLVTVLCRPDAARDSISKTLSLEELDADLTQLTAQGSLQPALSRALPA